jgi:hypothetical protein
MRTFTYRAVQCGACIARLILSVSPTAFDAVHLPTRLLREARTERKMLFV